MTAKTMTEVLSENMDQVFTAEYGDALAFTGDAEELAELLSAAGFGLVADAKAEALEEAADVMDKSAETLVMMWGDEPMNRVALATLTTTRHEARRVRNRAAALRGNS